MSQNSPCDTQLEASVLLPVRNGGEEFKRQLKALGAQDFDRAYETIIINNNSMDDSLATAEAYAQEHDHVRVLNVPQARSRAEALNAGARQVRTAKILTIDHDDWIHPLWVASMCDALETHQIASGSSLLTNEPLQYDDFEADGFQKSPPIHGNFWPFALGCNMAFTTDLFATLKGFDPSMDKAEDIDFCWRAQQLGHKIGWAPEAQILKSIRTSSKQRFNQHVGYGQADVALERRFAASGYRGVRRRAFKQLVWLARSIPLALSPTGRSGWLSVAGSVLGVVRGTISGRERR